ncbi:MAG: division/cell wall cluster transcriptional repressor MraZ [Anaerolineales bacterium]|jgi:MraZ protein
MPLLRENWSHFGGFLLAKTGTFIYTVGKLWDKVVNSGSPGDRRSVFNTGTEHMFLGQYRHSLDDKGRMIVPARFRDLLNGPIYLTQGFDQNLRVLPEAAFVSIYERVTEMSTTNPTARQLRRLIFSTAQQVDIDANGRILIPKYLRDVAHLDDEAIVVGVGEALEIWSPAAWETQNELLQDAESNAERFAALDI